MANNKKTEVKKMEVSVIKNFKLKAAKINTVEDYYKIFLHFFKSEHKDLYGKEHFWIMGMDSDGYSVCLYLVSLGSENMVKVPMTDVFNTAINHKATNIVIAHNHTTRKKPEPSQFDIDFTNKLSHVSQYLNINVLDHIILSHLSLESKESIYYSFLVAGLMDFFKQDTTYKLVDDVKDILEDEKKDYGDDMKNVGKKEGEHNKAIEIAKEMLMENEDIKTIIKYTKFTEKEINKIKNSLNK